MKTNAEEPHILVAAYVLGALTERDSRTFTAHLPSCAPVPHGA
jgi:hypothetical protein